MNLFGLQITRAAPPSPIRDDRGGWRRLVREPFAGAWQRNMEWTIDTVLAHPAVYACVSLIAQDIGKLRPKLVELGENGIWKEVSSPAFSPVLRQPNRFQTHNQFKQWWTTCRLIHGNTYALKERDERGVVVRLYVLDPTRVTVLAAPDGEVFYQLKADNLSGLTLDEVAVPASEIIHDRLNPIFHPLVGISPLFASGAVAQLGLNIQNNSASFFGNGSNPSGILSTPVSIGPGKAEELSDIWNSQFGGGNTGRVAVLGDGMKFEAMRMTAVDSQLIEQDRHTSELICAAFHVPAWKIGLAPMPAYTSPEIANRTYYTDCLQSHIEDYESCMDAGLGLTTPTNTGRVLGVELAVQEGLFRMDTATQIRTLVEAVKGGVYTPNEARQEVDKESLPGGDTIWLQQQDVPIEAAFKAAMEPPPPPPALPPAPEPAALLPGEPDPAEREAPEPEHGLQMWEGWFARDTLSLHREAQSFAIRIAPPAPAPDVAATRMMERLDRLERAPHEREATPVVVNVTTPDVHVTLPEFTLAPAPVSVTMEAPKPGTRSLVVQRPDGSILTADVTETHG